MRSSAGTSSTNCESGTLSSFWQPAQTASAPCLEVPMPLLLQRGVPRRDSLRRVVSMQWLPSDRLEAIRLARFCCPRAAGSASTAANPAQRPVARRPSLKPPSSALSPLVLAPSTGGRKPCGQLPPTADALLHTRCDPTPRGRLCMAQSCLQRSPLPGRGHLVHIPSGGLPDQPKRNTVSQAAALASQYDWKTVPFTASPLSIGTSTRSIGHGPPQPALAMAM